MFRFAGKWESDDIKVDATILEVGVGGMYDCTNIVPKPVVAGVSALGIDHVAVLGKTLKEIAWQKGGIYKVRERCVEFYTTNMMHRKVFQH